MDPKKLWSGHVELNIIDGQKWIKAVGDEGYLTQNINASDIFLGGKVFDSLAKNLNKK